MKLTPLFFSSLIASAGLHAALVVSPYSTDLTLFGSTGSVMSVKLENKAEDVVTPEKRKTFEKKSEIKPKIEPKQKSTTQKNKLVKPTEIISQKKTVEDKPAYFQEKQQAESRAHVISIIYKELQPYFSYPKLAVRRNWQGKVLLSLQVTSSGHIKKIQIAKSSGYNLLDQAAIKALSKIENLPYTSNWLATDIELNLPIIYKLTKG